MANPKIKVKRSSVEGKVPAVTQLERGELAVNSYDGKVYIVKDQFSVGIATTTHTVNPWDEPNGVGAGISYSGDIRISGIATFSKSIRADNGIIIGSDNKSILLGASDDMRIRHTGSHSEITDEGTGDLRLGASRTIIGNPSFSETCARFVQNGSSELYHDNTLRLKTSRSGVNITDDLGVSGVSTFSGGVKLDGSNADFDDEVKIRMGDSQDLLIFHQESNGNSIIREQGGGVLSLQTNGAYMNIYDSTNQQTMAQFTNGGAAQFRHNGTIRLQTTSSGAEVIGTLETDALTLGNFNMPTTIGAQDTVLKSDGTNVVFGSAASATFTEEGFTATQGQTVFTASSTLPTYIQVFVNGIKIRPSTDFSKSGASITLSSGATAGDEIDIVRFD